MCRMLCRHMRHVRLGLFAHRVQLSLRLELGCLSLNARFLEFTPGLFVLGMLLLSDCSCEPSERLVLRRLALKLRRLALCSFSLLVGQHGLQG